MKAEIQTRRSELHKQFFLKALLLVACDELAEEKARLARLIREHGGDPNEFGLIRGVPVPAA